MKKAQSQLAMESQPVRQPAATFDEMHDAAMKATDPQIRAFIMLLWTLAGRKGDIAKLRKGSVQLDVPKPGDIQVFVQDGKGVMVRRGKYNLASVVPSPWRQELASFIRAQDVSAPEHRFLFRRSLGLNSEVLNAIRLTNPQLSVRSVRRGALQALGADPNVAPETIMQLSGHRRKETLERYLDWGSHSAKDHRDTRRAAANLGISKRQAPAASPPPAPAPAPPGPPVTVVA